MDRFFGIAGTVLLVLLCIVLFVLSLLVLICLSHPKIIIKYKDKQELSASLWFIRFNITKFLSRKKKQKPPKVYHFDGTSFGELPCQPDKNKKNKKKYNGASHITDKTQQDKAKKDAVSESSDASSSEEEKVPVTEKVSEIFGLVTDILENIREPLKKVLKVDIKRLYLTAASDDPHKTAVLFGNMNTAMGTLIFTCRKFAGLNINENSTGVYSDFVSSAKPGIDAHIVLTLSFRHIILCGWQAVKHIFLQKNN